MSPMESNITDAQIKAAANVVRTTIYESLDYPPPQKLPTELIFSAIEGISGYKIRPVVIDKVRMGCLRGMLVTHQKFGEFEKLKQAGVTENYKGVAFGDDDPIGIILISDDNNACWQRFTAVKEASHLVLEREDLMHSTDVSELAKAVVQKGNRNVPFGRQVLMNREEAGERAAIEILLPDAVRDNCERYINVEGLDSLKIANKFKVPQKFVEFRLDEWGIAPPG